MTERKSCLGNLMSVPKPDQAQARCRARGHSTRGNPRAYPISCACHRNPILGSHPRHGPRTWLSHPSWGGWLQLPHEFDAILAKEDKAVAQVVLAIMRKTLGWVDPRGGTDSHGSPKRIEWAHIDSKHFKAICGGSSSQANRGIQAALELHSHRTRADQDCPPAGLGNTRRCPEQRPRWRLRVSHPLDPGQFFLRFRL